MSKLIKECEGTIDAVFPMEERKKARPEEEAGVSDPVAGDGIFRNTVVALRTMQEMRKGSSTISQFSLPPLNLPDSDLARFLQLNSPIQIS